MSTVIQCWLLETKENLTVFIKTLFYSCHIKLLCSFTLSGVILAVLIGCLNWKCFHCGWGLGWKVPHVTETERQKWMWRKTKRSSAENRGRRALPWGVPPLWSSEWASSLNQRLSPSPPSRSPEAWSSAWGHRHTSLLLHHHRGSLHLCVWGGELTCVLCSCSSSTCSSRAFLASASSSRAATSNMLSR